MSGDELDQEDVSKALFGSSESESDGEAFVPATLADEDYQDKPSKRRKRKTAKPKKQRKKTKTMEKETTVLDGEKKKPKRKKTLRKKKKESEPAPVPTLEATSAPQQEEEVTLRPFGGVDGESEAEESEMDEFDEVLSKLRKRHRPRKGSQTVDQIEAAVKNLLEKMEIACEEEDRRAVEENGVAGERLKLLPFVRHQLKKRQLQEIFVTSGILPVLRKWLEPMPDGSLVSPLVTLQVFDILRELPVSEEPLQQSGVGQLVMFTFKMSKDVNVRREAQSLLERWTRPIFKKTMQWSDLRKQGVKRTARLQQKDYYDRVDQFLDKKKKVNPELDRVVVEEGDEIFSPHARIPAAMSMDFNAPPVVERKESIVRVPRHTSLKKRVIKMKRGDHRALVEIEQRLFFARKKIMDGVYKQS